MQSFVKVENFTNTNNNTETKSWSGLKFVLKSLVLMLN